jgi:hypothetical protein
MEDNIAISLEEMGHAVAQLDRKFAGSIPDDIFGIFR